MTQWCGGHGEGLYSFIQGLSTKKNNKLIVLKGMC